MRTLHNLCFLLLLPLAARPVVAQGEGADDAAAISADSLFSQWRGLSTPGCAAGITRKGTVLFRHAYGMANLETGTANTPQTVFLAASLAKQFTAMAIMLLVHDGRLSLDEEIHRLIPELPDYGSPITVRQLLTHTSGLRDFFEMLILARGRFEEDRITQADAMDIILRQRALNFSPGTEYLYSNTGYLLLALVVERVTGRSLAEFTAAEIFTPLGMSHTSFRDDYSIWIPGRATGYARRGEGWRLSFANYDIVGPTNLYTTIDDLMIWSDNLARPIIGDSSMTRQMMTKAVLANGDSVGYGFGLGLWTDHGSPVAEHEGSDPGFRAFLGRYPAQGLAVAILCNTRSADAVSLGHRLASLYLGWQSGQEDPHPPLAPAVVDSGAVASRAGVYFQPIEREIIELAWRGGSLYTSPVGGRRLLPISRDSFQLEGLPVVYVFGHAPHAAFSVTPLLPRHHPTRFEWRASPNTAPAGLARYAGAFVSPDLHAEYLVTVRDSTLELRVGTSPALVARPVFVDTFTSGQLVVEFMRSRGQVVGFQLTHPRARGLVFTRQSR